MSYDRTTTMIFSTDGGIVAIDSPVKLKILDLLRNGTTAFVELVEKTGKAKATVSVHMDQLEKLNLVQEKTYPGDKRKKYFVLKSIYLACSEIPLRDQYYKHLDNMVISGLNGDSFIKNIFHTIRYGMEAYGFNTQPIMKRLGNDIGIKIGQGFKSDDSEGVLNELSNFWKDHELGNITIINNCNPAILVINCFNYYKMPCVGKTLCSFDEGIIEGIFSSRLKLKYNVKETECFGTGHDLCKFVVKKT